MNRVIHALLSAAALLCGCAAPAANGAADLTGPDLNRDGVRDDVERELTRTYNPPERQDVLLAARAFQNLLNHGVTGTDRQALMDAATAYMTAKTCLDNRHGYALMADAGQDIVALTINTDARARAFTALNSALSGGAFLEDSGACLPEP